jgi:hypothetical protein
LEIGGSALITAVNDVNVYRSVCFVTDPDCIAALAGMDGQEIDFKKVSHNILSLKSLTPQTQSLQL